MTAHSSCASSGSEPLTFPDWQGLYHAAVLEMDRHMLLKRVQAAEAAILKRLEVLHATSEISSNAKPCSTPWVRCDFPNWTW
jgi:hypothetical protein